MAELKTVPSGADVEAFLERISDPARRADCRAVLELMQRATGCPPKMWGDRIVGFGSYRYRYRTGREGDWFLSGFASRKRDLTLYVMSGFERSPEIMARLGKYKTGKSCLYVAKLADVDTGALEDLVVASVRHLRATYP
jgi:hypothetical protein